MALVCGLTRETGLSEWSELILSQLEWDEILRAFREMNTDLADRKIAPDAIRSPLARNQIQEFRERAGSGFHAEWFKLRCILDVLSQPANDYRPIWDVFQGFRSTANIDGFQTARNALPSDDHRYLLHFMLSPVTRSTLQKWENPDPTVRVAHRVCRRIARAAETPPSRPSDPFHLASETVRLGTADPKRWKRVLTDPGCPRADRVAVARRNENRPGMGAYELDEVRQPRGAGACARHIPGSEPNARHVVPPPRLEARARPNQGHPVPIRHPQTTTPRPPFRGDRG